MRKNHKQPLLNSSWLKWSKCLKSPRNKVFNSISGQTSWHWPKDWKVHHIWQPSSPARRWWPLWDAGSSDAPAWPWPSAEWRSRVAWWPCAALRPAATSHSLSETPVTQPTLYIITPVTQPTLYIITPVTQPTLYIITPVTQPTLYIITPVTQPTLTTPITQPTLILQHQPHSPHLQHLWHSPHLQHLWHSPHLQHLSYSPYLQHPSHSPHNMSHSPHLQHLSHSPHLQHLSHSPYLQHLSHSPHLQHLSHSPHLQHLSHNPHLQHLSHIPYNTYHTAHTYITTPVTQPKFTTSITQPTPTLQHLSHSPHLQHLSHSPHLHYNTCHLQHLPHNRHFQHLSQTDLVLANLEVVHVEVHGHEEDLDIILGTQQPTRQQDLIQLYELLAKQNKHKSAWKMPRPTSIWHQFKVKESDWHFFLIDRMCDKGYNHDSQTAVFNGLHKLKQLQYIVVFLFIF